MKRLLTFFLSGIGLFSIAFSYDLRLTEVFVDGTDEWVEISNMSSDAFVGNLSLSGAKSTFVNLSSVSIPAWSSVIAGDTLSMFSSFSGFQVISGLALNLGDTSPLDMSLFSNTTLLDAFIVSSGSVIAIDNQKTSFHKNFTSGLPTIVPTLKSLSFGLGVGYYGHPGRVYNANGSLLIPQSIVSTGTTGGTSGLTQIDCSLITSGILQVEELHDGNQYSDYIEILFLTDWVGGLQFSGSALSQGFSLPSQSRKAHTRYLISNGTTNFHHTDNVIVVPGWLLQQGLLEILSDTTTPLSYSLVDSSGQSLYYTQSYSCVKSFATVGSPSPGFDEQFLSYLNTSTITQTITGNCSMTGLNGTGVATGTGINNGSSGANTLLGLGWHDVRVSLIDYDPPGSDTNNERIGLTALTGSGLLLSGFSLSYDGKFFYFATGTLFSGMETIITGNYVFVNSRPVCISLYYHQTQVDTACYDPSQDSSPFLPLGGVLSGTGVLQSGNDQLDYAGLVFDITNVVYDPPGSDTNNETVTITFLSGADSVLLDNFRLRVGTSNRRIYGTILSGQMLTLIGNFIMSNSTPTCIALTYNEILYDEYCYNPISYPSISPSTASVFDLSSALYRDRRIVLTAIDYDPEGNDADRETISLHMTGDQSFVNLEKFYIRFGSTKRPLKGTLFSGTPFILTGNYALPNTKSTCVDLMEGTHIFDTYCYYPLLTIDKVDKLLTGLVLSGMINQLSGVSLIAIDYDPEGNDTDRETVEVRFPISGLLLSGSLSIHFGTTNKLLTKDVLLSGDMIFSGNYSLPNAKATCVDLLYNNTYILDTLCYDPTQKEKSDTITDRGDYYSGLQLQRILPNPKGKDTKRSNEKFALHWDFGSGQKLTKEVKIIIGKTSILLSGFSFDSSELVILSPKALTNQAACARLVVDGKEIDRICYPQAKEGLVYYHPRLARGPQTIPRSLTDSLDAQGVDLSDLRLQKLGKQVCLRYHDISIRCMAAGASTSPQSRALITLSNAYIREMGALINNKNMNYTLMDQRTESYRLLSKSIKSGSLTVSPYGHVIKSTDLASYKTLIYEKQAHDIVIDALARSLVGDEKVRKWYRDI